LIAPAKLAADNYPVFGVIDCGWVFRIFARDNFRFRIALG